MTGPPIERGPWTGDLGQWINPQTGITVSAGDDTVLQVTGVTFVNGTLTGNARDLQVTISGGGGGLPPGGFLEQPLVNDGTSGGGEWSNTISSRSAPPDAPPTNGAALALYGESGLNDDDVIGYGGSISVGGGTGDSGDGAYGGNSIVEGGAAGTYGGGIVGGYGANSDSGGGAARMFGGYGGPDASAAEINVGGAAPFSPASIQITAGATYTQGGNVTVAGGVGTTDPGGNVYFSGGASTSGDGGNSEFLGGASTSGIGGEAVMQSGAGSVAGNVSIYAASGTISNGDINITLNNTVLGTAGKLNVSGLPTAVAGLPTNALWVDPSTGCVVAAPGTGPSGGGGSAIGPLGFGTTLDMSGVTNILDNSGGVLTVSPFTSLNVDDSLLTSLDVSGAAALTTLECFGNQLTTLDVSGAAALTTLDCDDNMLTTLDVSTNTALTTLDCGNNQLTTLDVSTNAALTTLGCPGNQLTTLDVSTNTALTTLGCDDNLLTTSAVNAIFVALAGFGNSNGYANSLGQTPPAPPSGAGAAAVVTLQGLGWTVVTD
jgi:hypothetical protein